MNKKGILTVSAAIAVALTMTVGCGTTNTDSNTTSASGKGGSSNGGTIALLLTDATSSARYEAQDKPDFTAEVKKLDSSVTVNYQNAQGDASTQQQQAEAAITNGAKVLVIDPVDSQAAAAIVTSAKKAGVKVISYDRLITKAPVDFYVS